MLDLNQDTGHSCESEERSEIGAIAHGNEDIDNLSTSLKPSKRKLSDPETDSRAPKSRKERRLESSEDDQETVIIGPKGRDNGKSTSKPMESFTDLAEISQKILEPDEVPRILTQRCHEKYHSKVAFLTRLFFAIASPQAVRQLSEACCGKVCNSVQTATTSNVIASVSRKATATISSVVRASGD
jgi:hypothetical protein